MAWEARSGLKPEQVRIGASDGLNGLGSPFGFETNTFFDVPIRNPLNRLNGLGSPFGFETAGFSTDSAYSFGAKWPGKPVRV